MKFDELAACLAPALPGGLAPAERIRELISMCTIVTEDEWGTRNDPTALPSDSVLESMASRAAGFTKKLATAICARLGINAFIERMDEPDLDTQELIARNIAAHDEHVDLENFAYDATDPFGPDDFAVLCKPCTERFNLAHTEANLAPLRAHNQTLNAAESVDGGLAPRGLDTTQINAHMRRVMDALYPEEPRKAPIFTFKAATKGVSCTFDHNGDTGSGAEFNHLVALDIAVLRSTPLPFLIQDSAFIKLIAYKPAAELLAVYSHTANLTSKAEKPKQVFFSFDATEAYGTKAEERVAPAQVIHLDDGAEALYGFTWDTETTDDHDPQPNEGGSDR